MIPYYNFWMNNWEYRKKGSYGEQSWENELILQHVDFKQPMRHRRKSIKNALRKMESH